MHTPITSTEIRAAYQAALQLGAEESYDDCIGGDLRAPHDASAECAAAVAEYRQMCRRHQAYVHGPELREYYFGRR